MFLKSLLFTIAAATAVSNAPAAIAKPGDATDTMVSTHNYKHANKAAAARKMSGNAILRLTASSGAVANVSRRHKTHASTTPRYAASKPALIVFTNNKKVASGINPLLSERNYKTANRPSVNPGTPLVSETR